MILIINNTKFKARFNKSGHLIIKLKKTKDKIYFNAWENKVREN